MVLREPLLYFSSFRIKLALYLALHNRTQGDNVLGWLKIDISKPYSIHHSLREPRHYVKEARLATWRKRPVSEIPPEENGVSEREVSPANVTEQRDLSPPPDPPSGAILMGISDA